MAETELNLNALTHIKIEIDNNELVHALLIQTSSGLTHDCMQKCIRFDIKHNRWMIQTLDCIEEQKHKKATMELQV